MSNQEKNRADQDVFDFIEPAEGLANYVDGRDELNFAEFPVCSVSAIPRKGPQELSFEDQIVDSSTGEVIKRKLSVVGSSKHGLPTSTEDEILLGLIQLTRLAGFRSRTIRFSRYDLMRLLGWEDSTQNYRRIERAMDRWIGTYLDYENAWWDKEDQSWVSEKFNVISYVKLYKRGSGLPPHQCEISWNPLVFRSFRSGNIKQLDFQQFKSLELSASKRLFRYLDKKFYQRSRWSFDIADFCYEKLGMSRRYSVSQLKRRLEPSIRELENSGFLKPMTQAERFKKVRVGEWDVYFERGEAMKPKILDDSKDQRQEAIVEDALISRGVSPKRARRFLADNPHEYIEAKIELLDWYLEKGGASAPRDSGAWLAQAIEDDHQPPTQFRSKEERQREQRMRQEEQAARRKLRLKVADEARKSQEAEEARIEREEALVARYLAGLEKEEAAKLRAAILEQMPSVWKLDQEGTLFETAFQDAQHRYIIALLNEEGQASQ